ncbi:hypothetical protein [Endozoicomonas sp. Mp262]|uniref:hypothetical protein n=1 Tax=Endozoicomonas sp. Mp262 TaxID=2919499 RepID=UPI0021DA9BE3
MHAVYSDTEELVVKQKSHSLNANDYRDCHPYIYWWIRTVLKPLCRKTVNVSDFRLYQAFKTKGFKSELVKESLRGFIRTHGQIIQSWFLQKSPKPCPPLEYTDIEYAITASKNSLL